MEQVSTESDEEYVGNESYEEEYPREKTSRKEYAREKSLREEYVRSESDEENYVSQDTLLSILPILGSFLPQEALQYLHSSTSNINQVLVKTERDPGFWIRKIESEFNIIIPEFSSMQERKGSIWKRNDWKQVYYEMIEEDPLRSDNPDIIEILLTNPRHQNNLNGVKDAAVEGRIEALKVFLSDPKLEPEIKERAFLQSARAGELESAKILLNEKELNVFGKLGLLESVVDEGYPDFVQLIFDSFETDITQNKKQALLQKSYENQEHRIRLEEANKRRSERRAEQLLKRRLNK